MNPSVEPTPDIITLGTWCRKNPDGLRFLAHLVTNGPTRHCIQGGVQLLLMELFVMKNYLILKNFHLLASGFIHNLNRCVCVCQNSKNQKKSLFYRAVVLDK